MAPPTAIGACPAKADDLTPFVNDEGNNFATEADALTYFKSIYSNFPPNALCKNANGTYAINTSAIGDTIESALQKLDTKVSRGSLLNEVVSLRASIQKLKETIGSAEQAIQELQAQLKTNPPQGLSADDASASFISVTLEFGIFTFLIGSSFYSADLFSSWLLGKMGPMAHLGMANRRAISSRINQFKDQYGLCGSLMSDKAITALTHILGGCVTAYVSYQSMDALFKYLNGKFYKTSGQAIDPALLKDPKQMGLVSDNEIAKAFAALNGKSDAELQAESARLLKEFTGLELRHTALEINRAELTRVSRERLIARGILNEDVTPATPEGLMAKVWEKSKQAPSETIGMLVGFGVGVGAVAGILYSLRHSKGMQALNNRALKNAVAAANKRIARLIESGKLTVCKGSHLTKEQLMALANKILRPEREPQQLTLPGMGKADVPDGTRAELEMSRLPPSPQPSSLKGEGVTRVPSPLVGEGQGEGLTAPDGIPSRPEFTPMPAAMRAEWTAREQANAVWRQFTQNAEVVPQRRHQQATLIDMAYKTYQDLIKIMPPHTWDKIAWDMAHMYRIAAITTHGDVHGQMFRARDVYAAFWKKFGLRINLYDIWLESAKPAGMIDTMANVLQRTGMNHPSFLLTQATPVILAAAKEGARARGEPWDPQDEKRVGEDIHALAGLFNAERAARLANNVLTITEATKRLVWSLWHMSSAARGGLRLLPAAAWYGSLHPLQASELLSQALATGASKGGRGRATARTGGPSPRGRVLGKLGAAYNTFAWALFGVEVYIHFDNTPAPSNWRSLSPTQRTGWVISEVGFVFAEGTSSLVCNVLPGATSIIPNCGQYIVPDNPCPEGSVQMKPDFGPLFGLSPHCVPMR